MEFFSADVRAPDERLVATMSALGSQVVRRPSAEQDAVRERVAVAGHVEAALDAVVTMDARGRVVGWNHAAQTIFGYEPARPSAGRWPNSSSHRTSATPTGAGSRGSSTPGNRSCSIAGSR